MKNRWWANKADELQSYADQHATKAFFSGLKTVFGPTSINTAPIRSKDGTLLTEKHDILNRWTEHFDTLLNRPSSIDQSAIADIVQRPLVMELDTPPSAKEVKDAIHLL